jgi:hypothetical protein
MKQGKKFLDRPNDREVISNIIRTLGSVAFGKVSKPTLEALMEGKNV